MNSSLAWGGDTGLIPPKPGCLRHENVQAVMMSVGALYRAGELHTIKDAVDALEMPLLSTAAESYLDALMEAIGKQITELGSSENVSP